jgi:hypothetical protein
VSSVQWKANKGGDCTPGPALCTRGLGQLWGLQGGKRGVDLLVPFRMVVKVTTAGL